MATTDSYFKPDKEREFRLYVIWKSLDHSMDRKLFEQLGVRDELLLELAGLKTQKAFGKEYNIDTKTMSTWNKHIFEENIDPELKKLDWRYWARQVTPKMASALVREGIKTGDPHRFNAFMKHVHGDGEEKTRVALTDADGNSIGGLAGLIAGAEKVLKARGESN
jgi:hypothetical protein